MGVMKKPKKDKEGYCSSYCPFLTIKNLNCYRDKYKSYLYTGQYDSAESRTVPVSDCN